MFIWFVLFFLILVVSVFVALRSIRGVDQNGGQRAIYLIRKPLDLTKFVLDDLIGRCIQQKQIIVFERLFKGEKTALVCVGPAHLFEHLTGELGLLELEDYSQSDNLKVLAWECQIVRSELKELFLAKGLTLADNEELWLQVVLRSHMEGVWDKVFQFAKLIQGTPSDLFTLVKSRKELGLQKEFRLLKATLRIVIRAEDETRAQELKDKILDASSEAGVVKLPQQFSSSTLLNFYKQRLPSQTKGDFLVNSAEIKLLIG